MFDSNVTFVVAFGSHVDLVLVFGPMPITWVHAPLLPILSITISGVVQLLYHQHDPTVNVAKMLKIGFYFIYERLK